MSDYLFRGSLADLDPAIFELGQIEAERQFRKLILIPSESTAPQIRVVRKVRHGILEQSYNLD